MLFYPDLPLSTSFCIIVIPITLSYNIVKEHSLESSTPWSNFESRLRAKTSHFSFPVA